MTDELGRIMSGRGRLATQVATAVTELVLAGARLGELETVQAIGKDGKPRAIQVPPAVWFRRLERAVEVGAFLKKSPQQIAAIILSTPEVA